MIYLKPMTGLWLFPPKNDQTTRPHPDNAGDNPDANNSGHCAAAVLGYGGKKMIKFIVLGLAQREWRTVCGRCKATGLRNLT